MAAYVGSPRPLSTLLYDPPRSLRVQACDPKEQLRGSVNVDGTGVAWWVGDDPEPLRYRTERPPWSDPNLPDLAARLSGRLQLAAVRSATRGIPYGPPFVHPFVHEHLAGAHNGWLGEFRRSTAGVLLGRLPDHLRGALDGMSDSQLLFLTAVGHLQAQPGGGLAGAVRAAVTEAAEVCAAHGAQAALNLVVADGARVVAARLSLGVPANSLYTLERGQRWPDGVLLASEPLDDDAWTPVPDRCLAELTSAGVRLSPIDDLERIA